MLYSSSRRDMKKKHTAHLVLTAVAALFTLFTASCAKPEEVVIPPLELPATPILANRSQYAVITSTHLRLRDGPSSQSRVRETLWKGAVMEVTGKVSGRMVVENQEGHWYQVSYDGLHGYVFGAYLRFFENREAAVEASRNPDF
jgi:uncharacterized protein YgiM (DUF1202 family)